MHQNIIEFDIHTGHMSGICRILSQFSSKLLTVGVFRHAKEIQYVIHGKRQWKR